jgi:membrane protein YdbS with pleckstrin-like domain
MALLDRLLAPDEPAHLVTREHGVALVAPFVRAGAVLLAASGVAILAAGLPLPAPIRLVPILVVAAVAARALLRLVHAVSGWQRRVLVVTDRRAVLVSGRLARRTEIVPLHAISDVEIVSSGAGRALHYGGVVVCTGGRRGLLFGLRRLPDPDELLALLLGLAEEGVALQPRRSRAAAASWALSIAE